MTIQTWSSRSFVISCGPQNQNGIRSWQISYMWIDFTITGNSSFYSRKIIAPDILQKILKVELLGIAWFSSTNEKFSNKMGWTCKRGNHMKEWLKSWCILLILHHSCADMGIAIAPLFATNLYAGLIYWSADWLTLNLCPVFSRLTLNYNMIG